MPIFYEQSVVLLLPAVRLCGMRGAPRTRPSRDQIAAADEGAAAGVTSADGRRRALVVEPCTAATIGCHAEPVVDEVVAGAAQHVRQLVAAQQPHDRPASAGGSCGGTSSPVTPSSIISGIPPTFDATTGRERAIASRIVRPWASR